MVIKKPNPQYFVIEITALDPKNAINWKAVEGFGVCGFTLVELLIVMAIIGALATMTIPSFNGYLKTTKNKTCMTDLRTIDKAIVAYFIDRNTLPASLADVGMASQLDPWKRPYIYKNHADVGAVPLEGFFGNRLNLDYDLYSKGENGVSIETSGNPNNDDDIVRTSDGSSVDVRSKL